MNTRCNDCEYIVRQCICAAKYAVGNRLYFSPSLDRMPHGSAIPAGMVEVLEVVDHGPIKYAPLTQPRPERFTYFVYRVGTNGDGKQGASESELYEWKG
jgi:hypothetical protein